MRFHTMLESGAMYTRLHLSISCKGLVNLDAMSRSDPFVVSLVPYLLHPFVYTASHFFFFPSGWR